MHNVDIVISNCMISIHGCVYDIGWLCYIVCMCVCVSVSVCVPIATDINMESYVMLCVTIGTDSI